MGRQLGVAVGLAVLVALLGSPQSVADFDAAYAFILAGSLASGLVLAALGHVEVAVAEPEAEAVTA